MKYGAIPSKWFGWADRIDARFMLEVAERADQRGIDHHDEPGIKKIIAEVKKDMPPDEAG